MMIDRRLVSHFDWWLLALVFVLAGVGVASIYSAAEPGARGLGQIFAVKQAIWFSLGLVVMALVFSFHYHFMDRWVWVIYILTVLSLAWVLVFGKTVSGSQRWISLGPLAFQPSETAKLTAVIVLAHFYSRSGSASGLGLREIALPAALLFVPFLLILAQPDLGTGMVMAIIAASMTFYAGIRRRTLIFLVSTALVALPLLYMNLKDYQKGRIKTFLDPDRDPLGAGYHIIQSKIAIGSGMFSGKGYMEGSQKALSFLPEQHTDFIFAVLAEEWGLLGATALLILFFAFLWRGLNVGYQSKDPFGAYVCVGVASYFFWQVFINIGMVMGILPVVGVPLPFISYGGSSMLVAMMGVGMMLNIGMRRFSYD